MTRTTKIPLTLKLLYTLFMCVLVPIYWRNYGPKNFLFFCDVALFVTLVAIWWENSLLASTQALGILIPQSIWVFDFVVGLVTGTPPLGSTAYMFEEHRPLYLRGLSLFHGWLPILLVWMVWRLGYDRRALVVQTVLAWIILLLCYWLTDPPPRNPERPHAAINVNYVFGFPEDNLQTWMPPQFWLLSLMAFYAICIHVPTHFVLAWLFGKRKPGEITPANRGDDEGGKTVEP